MSRRLIPCAACERHVRATELACPFCEAPRPREVGASALALSALMLAACDVPAPAPAPEATPEATSAASASAVKPAASTSPAPDATDAGVPEDAGAPVDAGPDAAAIDAGRPDASTMQYRPAAPRYGMPPDKRRPF